MDMEPEDHKYTAFTAGCSGFYEWKRLPMGLCNSASTFQQMMEAVMGNANLECCLLYLDDLIVFSSSFEQHLQRLEVVLSKLEAAGLKLKPSKCCLFQILNWPVPADRKQLHRFLGYTGYYRRFVKDYSKLAYPLQKLLCGEDKKKTAKKNKR